MGVATNSVRRWNTGEMRAAAMTRAFLKILLRLRRAGLDLNELDEGRVRWRRELKYAE